MEIIDNLKVETKVKPIQLISCLQHSTSLSPTGNPYFAGTVNNKHNWPYKVSKIERVAKLVIDCKEVSVVVITLDQKNVTVWLANWNDGVAPV